MTRRIGPGRPPVAESAALEPLALYGPGILALDAPGNAYVAVSDGIYKVSPAGAAQRIAGTKRNWRYAGDGGPGQTAGINPRDLALDHSGNLFIADTGNHRIRKLSLSTGTITT
jgi:hypothetical protein